MSAPALFCSHFPWTSSVSCPNAMAISPAFLSHPSPFPPIVNTASRITFLKYKIHFLDYQPWCLSTAHRIRFKSDWTLRSQIGAEPAFFWSSTTMLLCGPYWYCIFLKILSNFLSLVLRFAFYYCCLDFSLLRLENLGLSFKALVKHWLHVDSLPDPLRQKGWLYCISFSTRFNFLMLATL